MRENSVPQPSRRAAGGLLLGGLLSTAEPAQDSQTMTVRTTSEQVLFSGALDRWVLYSRYGMVGPDGSLLPRSTEQEWGET